MRSRMHPSYYLSTEIFEREQKKIFRKLWLFAGLKTMLPTNNSFITRKISGIPVVIQNFHGEINAFENVCLHRSAPLQSDPVGCRPMVCPYHAWKYDSDGKVSNIPHCEKIYHFDESTKNSLKLRKFSLRIIGNLIFINLSAEPLPLEDQFPAEFLASLEDSSNSYDSEVMMTTWQCHFNWKLVYENLRDANHVAFVHPRTLAPFVSFLPVVDEDGAKQTQESLSDTSKAGLYKEMRQFSFGGPEGVPSEFNSFSWHKNVERWKFSNSSARVQASASKNGLSLPSERIDDSYFNWLIFPNVHIASGNGGHSFVIEHHIPITPDRTDVEIYRFTARKKQPYPTSSQVLLSEMHHSKLILSEDFGILEKVQSVLHTDAPIPTQGAYELKNRQIERWYTTLMETNHEL